MVRQRRHAWRRLACALVALVVAVQCSTNGGSGTASTHVPSTHASAPAPEATAAHPQHLMTTRAPHHLRGRNLTTWRPRRENCTPPAIEQFPKPMIGLEARREGGLILHVLVAVYTFIGLAIVCDDYFVASLDRICEELKLSPDVAGATFMAAGSSAPELATVVIGVFFAKDDIGVSGVIGSAVFNIMFVISVCALCTGTVAYLNWWPLVRDCFFYMISILVMLYTIYDETITWSESLLMLLMYGVYCVALHYNTALEQWAHSLPLPCHLEGPAPQGPRPPSEGSGLVQAAGVPPTYTEENNQQQLLALSPDQQRNKNPFDVAENGGSEPPPRPPAPETAVPVTNGAPEYYHKPPRPPLEETDPFVIPEGRWNRFSWALCVPIHAMCRATTPDCRKEKWRNYYPLTFCMAMVWISFYSYIMVWMITVIGSTLGIPDTVMGLTFVAAGVSVPDALSSLAVVKDGYGDMAVSNAVGSNVFDILICLGLPWFLQTALIKPGSHVNVISKGLTYSTLSLLSTVAFLIIATHLNGWKLDRKYGWILMAWYVFFILFASLYELNVFGYMNPPECVSSY